MRRYCTERCKKRANHRADYRRRAATVKAKSREWLASDRGQDLTLQRRYGITLAERDAMIAAQGGTCAFCPRPAKYVDHDHDTGRVRGVLCNSHNTFLGRMGDGDPAKLNTFLRYLGLSETHRIEVS
jgi:hypothetical protein